MSFATYTGKSQIIEKHNDDVVICGAYRSPLTRARKGGLAQCTPEEMLGNVLKGLIAKTGVDPKLIEDVSVGNVLPLVVVLQVLARLPCGLASLTRLL